MTLEFAAGLAGPSSLEFNALLRLDYSKKLHHSSISGRDATGLWTPFLYILNSVAHQASGLMSLSSRMEGCRESNILGNYGGFTKKLISYRRMQLTLLPKYYILHTDAHRTWAYG